jgi:hypothetical protein
VSEDDADPGAAWQMAASRGAKYWEAAISNWCEEWVMRGTGKP